MVATRFGGPAHPSRLRGIDWTSDPDLRGVLRLRGALFRMTPVRFVGNWLMPSTWMPNLLSLLGRGNLTWGTLRDRRIRAASSDNSEENGLPRESPQQGSRQLLSERYLHEPGLPNAGGRGGALTGAGGRGPWAEDQRNWLDGHAVQSYGLSGSSGSASLVCGAVELKWQRGQGELEGRRRCAEGGRAECVRPDPG